jgi:hypothetical protein
MAMSIAALVGAPAELAAQNGSHAPAAQRLDRGRAVQSSTPAAIPEQFAPPQESYASFPDSDGTGSASTPPSACQVRLAKTAVFQALGTLVGPGDCGAPDAVQLQTILLPDQSKVAVTPPATLRCSIAEQITEWVRNEIAPSLAEFGPPLRVLDNFDSYECRGRNRVRAAALSEHGRADALDIRGFRLADGRELGLTDVKVEKDWREKIRSTACTRFSTVLGPGSDGYHEEHIHVDLAERRNGYKLCQWDVREPPVPQAQGQPASSDNAETAEHAEAIAPEDVPLPRPRPRTANLISNRMKKNPAP